MKKLSLITTFFCLTSLVALSQQKTFRCFDCDNNIKIKISVEYLGDKPISLKYKGQSSSITLKKIEGSLKFRDGYSVFTESYTEIVNGQTNGKYNFTHSGIYDYIEYIRRDGEKFKFTINLDDSLNSEGNGFRTTSCY